MARRIWAVWGSFIAVAALLLSAGGASAHALGPSGAHPTTVPTLASISVKTVKVGNNPVDVAFDPGNGELYVANTNSSSVSVIDGSTNKVVATVAVSADPIEVGYDAVNDEVYVLSQSTHEVTILSSANEIVDTISVDADPIVGMIAPTGNVYVTSHGTNGVGPGKVAVINATTNDVTNLAVGDEAEAPYYDPANGDVYVGNLVSDSLTVITTALKVKTIDFGTGGDPFGLAYSPATKEMYVALFEDAEVDAISSANKIVARIQDTNVPVAISYNPANEDLYVIDEASLASSNLTIISSSNSVIETILTPETTSIGSVDTENGDFYLGTVAGDELVYSGAAMPAAVTSLTIGHIPLFAELDPTTDDVFVLKFAATGSVGEVFVFTSGNTLVTSKKVGDGGLTMVFDSANGDMYVANYGSDTVSVIT